MTRLEKALQRRPSPRQPAPSHVDAVAVAASPDAPGTVLLEVWVDERRASTLLSVAEARRLAAGILAAIRGVARADEQPGGR